MQFLKKIPVILSIVISLVSSQIIYPTTKLSPVQWLYEGSWHQCQDKSVILAQNCNTNDDNFIECYMIPSEGLCSDTIVSTFDDLYDVIEFNFQNKSLFSIEINGNQQNDIYNLEGQNKQVEVSFKNPKVPFVVQLNHKGGDELFMVQQNIQASNLVDNCVKQDVNASCLQCNDTYFLYNGQCAPKDCITQISNLVSNGISQRLSYTNGNVIQELIINNIQILGDCIVPRIYLIKSLDDPQLTYMFPQKYLTRPDQRSVLLTLPLSDFDKFPCDRLETSTDIVLQCYISFAGTVQGQTQLQYITLIRVSINKQTSSQVSYSDQGFIMPDQCCQSLSVDVLSEAQILKVATSGNQRYIVAQQILRDPSYKDRAIQFESASLTSDKVYNLQFVNSTIDSNTMTVTYYLLVDPSADITNQQTTVRIASNLAIMRRMLDSRVTNIKPAYVLTNIINLYAQRKEHIYAESPITINDQLKTQIKHKQSERDFTGLYELLVTVISLFFVYVAYITYKSYRKERDRARQFYQTEQKIIVSQNQLD